MNKRKRVLVLLINGMLLSSIYVASAADVTVGAGNGVAYGIDSQAPKIENVAIGNGSTIKYSNGNSHATGDIVVGSGAVINNYASQGGSVAIGKNAKVENMAGGQEASFALGQTTYSGGLLSSSRIPADPTKVVGSVAIGDNTFARTGSTMIGSHNYHGALGDTTVDTDSTRDMNLGVYSTTVGANSFSNGAFTTNTGTYNIISSDYRGGRSDEIFGTVLKNFGSTVNGAFNSIESKTAYRDNAGVANAITGVANRVFNSSGTLIYGAGNEVTNSDGPLVGFPIANTRSAKELATNLRSGARATALAGGSTMIIGGGNYADYTNHTAIIGVGNTVTGDSNSFRHSYENFVVGTQNVLSKANGTTVIGFNRSLANTENTIVIGNNVYNPDSITASDAVAIGTDTKVLFDGGVALGANSNANRSANESGGYDISTQAVSTDTSPTWKATDSAVSVGDVSNGVTRQIISVAAGTNDTDAVNVAQLKRIQNLIQGSSSDITTIKGNISKLDKRVNKAVAGSAALAALHPLDFDPNAKWDFAAGYGHYHNGNAAALGAFYRPNEDVQLSVGSTVGNGETVVNAGLSVKVGAHSNVSRSRVAIGKEVLELKKTVALQNAQIQKLTTLLNGVAGTNMKADRTTLFPDVPSNHWAYEAVSDLSRRGLVEGYPDGTFGGDRMLTRYEFAQIVYRAIQNGVQVNEHLVTEFSPEMALFRVDIVAKNHQGEPMIERVRVNKK